MTGIEQLRKLGADAIRGGEVGRAICDIADQIERERECERDTIENVRLIVGGVIDDMERHVSGVEGADDSPVARWARELREALSGDGRDHAADVSVSAYDLLPQEDRDAIAWVREHGGLDGVKKLLDWVVGHCSTKQQLDFDFWLSGRVMYELGFEEDIADREEVERRLLARLMPEGLEWPRFEDGEPVRIGDVVSDVEVRSVVFRDGGILLSDCTSVPGWGTWRSYKEPIKRPAVLAADGEPLEVGQTVWDANGDELVVGALEDGGRTVTCRYVDVGAGIPTHGMWSPSNLTHQRPVLDADGAPIKVGDTVYEVGENYPPFIVGRLPEPGAYRSVRVVYPSGAFTFLDPERLTHTKPEPPESWERIEDDARWMDSGADCGMFTYTHEDIVRRCRALAERERDE